MCQSLQQERRWRHSEREEKIAEGSRKRPGKYEHLNSTADTDPSTHRSASKGNKTARTKTGIFGAMAVQAESMHSHPPFASPNLVSTCSPVRSPTDVTTRLDRLIHDIRTRFHNPAIGKPKDDEAAQRSDVLLVAHGHILRAFAMRWIGRELSSGVSLLLEGKFASFLARVSLGGDFREIRG